MDVLKNKVAVITGAASGIGFELAGVLAEQGMKVVAADIEQDKLADAVRSLSTIHDNIMGVPVDVGDAASVESLARKAEQRFGAIHLACNNAGVFTGGHLWEATLEDYQWLMNVNQWGVIHGIRSFLPRMIAHGEPAHLVNTASMAALTSMPYSGIYNMTKHAVLALSETLYHELSLSAPQVGVSCVCPEMFNTGIAQSERNRPDDLANANRSDSRALAEQSISEAARTGKPPREIAERILRAVRENRFYVLAQDAWRRTANTRLEDIRLGRNPTFDPPVDAD